MSSIPSRIRHYLRRFRAPQKEHLEARREEHLELRRFLEHNADGDVYLELYSDVAAAGLDPIDHWLGNGFSEGRQFPGVEICRGWVKDAGWHRFSLGGEPISIRPTLVPRPPVSIIAQIRSQARHDTAVLAPGALALPNIRVFDSTDLMSRDGLGVSAIFGGVREQPAAIVIMPFLLMGGAEKYAADLVGALEACGVGPVMVLVTDQYEKDAAGWERFSILAPLQRADIMFWRDVCGSFGYSSPASLARFLNAMRPRFLFVTNSAVGLEAVARFGRGLSQFARIACTFFSMGVNALGAPYGAAYGARYPRRIMPFALALTDNDPMANTLLRLHGEIPGPGIRVIPPRIPEVPERIFAERLAARRKRSDDPRSGRHWAWVSRIEPFKGTALLIALAKARPADRFDVFGSFHPGAEDGMDLPNISLRAPLPDVVAADFSEYDGFLFTSLFEGMPNVVLEMSQQAIPMVLADVGGLRQTLDDRAAVFARHGEQAAESLLAFSRALDRVAEMDTEAVAAMVTAARSQVATRHAPGVHAQHVASMLEWGAPAPCR